MEYATALDVFFTAPPEEAPVIDPVVAGSPARRLRDAIEPIAAHAIWSREVNARCAERGLDFLTAYVLGRAAPLGEVPADVVVAAFGVFSPGLVSGLYDAARQTVDRADVLAIREETATAGLIAILDGRAEEDEIAEVAAVLRRGLDAAHPVARPLFAALAAQPWPDQAVGRLWRAAELLREHRGDGHLAVCVAQGLDPVEMNLLTELHCGMPLGAYTASRGWSKADIAAAARRLDGRGLVTAGALTDQGRRLRTEIEARTDLTQDRVLRAIGADLEPVIERVDRWSQAVIDAIGFPADPWKRAAG